MLYERLADELAAQILDGTLAVGERLPSLRRQAERWGVSVSTAVTAYHQLEARGLVEARPRSGTFVRPRIPEPTTGSPEARESPVPGPVTVIDAILDVIDAVRDPGAVPLGAAYAAPSLLPTGPLRRCLAAALRDGAEDAVTALDPAGWAPLRRRIARRSVLSGARLSSDEVSITHGATEALALALSAMAGPGAVVAVESPAYFGLLQLVDALGMRALEIPTCPVRGLEVDALERSLVGPAEHRPAALVVVPTFQNPLGACMPIERRRDLVDLAMAHDLPILEDDLFADLGWGLPRPEPAARVGRDRLGRNWHGQRPPSLAAFDRRSLVVRVGSFSKTLAPGYRVGWLAPARYADAVRRAKAVGSSATSAPAQMALGRYLDGPAYDRHLRQLRRTFHRTLGALAEAVLDAFPAGTRLLSPAGGFLLWVELPEGHDAVRLHELARGAGISIAPGPIFSASGAYRHCLRLNGGHPFDARIADAIRTLGTLAERARTL